VFYCSWHPACLELLLRHVDGVDVWVIYSREAAEGRLDFSFAGCTRQAQPLVQALLRCLDCQPPPAGPACTSPADMAKPRPTHATHKWHRHGLMTPASLALEVLYIKTALF
jgi:hypothetical protein